MNLLERQARPRARLRLPALLHGEFSDGLFPGLPWFLDDQHPQGFFGRAFARRVAADIGAPPDLLRWRADDIVLALLRHGDDLPGDLILGEAALAMAMDAMLHPRDVLPSAMAGSAPKTHNACPCTAGLVH